MVTLGRFADLPIEKVYWASAGAVWASTIPVERIVPKSQNLMGVSLSLVGSWVGLFRPGSLGDDLA